jgi:hypothetical protein
LGRLNKKLQILHKANSVSKPSSVEESTERKPMSALFFCSKWDGHVHEHSAVTAEVAKQLSRCC